MQSAFSPGVIRCCYSLPRSPCINQARHFICGQNSICCVRVPTEISLYYVSLCSYRFRRSAAYVGSQGVMYSDAVNRSTTATWFQRRASSLVYVHTFLSLSSGGDVAFGVAPCAPCGLWLGCQLSMFVVARLLILHLLVKDRFLTSLAPVVSCLEPASPCLSSAMSDSATDGSCTCRSHVESHDCAKVASIHCD